MRKVYLVLLTFMVFVCIVQVFKALGWNAEAFDLLGRIATLAWLYGAADKYLPNSGGYHA
jgi:hypothetical protein